MRSLIVGVVVVSSSSAFAQAVPPPAPVEQEAEVVQEPSSFALRAGAGFGRYSESGQGWSWKSDLQPFAIVGFDGAFPAGRGHLVLQGQAGLGSNVDMSSAQLGQTNGFHQEIFEASPRYRHPINARMYFEGGYRFTYQRLHFTDITTMANGNLGDANEYVSVHAIEAGIGWRRASLDGSRRHFAATVGLNRGGAENSRITGVTLHARGLSLDVRGGKRWASGMQFEGQFAYRKQNGSDPTTAIFDGMEVQAQWPKNTTWQLLAVLGFAL
jgi:hypothetical protein